MTRLKFCLNFALPVTVFMYEKEIYKKHFSAIVLEFARVLFVCLCVHLAQQHPALVVCYSIKHSVWFTAYTENNFIDHYMSCHAAMTDKIISSH